MYLCIKYKTDSLNTTTFMFDCFYDGYIRESDKFTIGKLFFNGVDKEDCLYNASKFISNINSICSRHRFDTLIKELTTKVSNNEI